MGCDGGTIPRRDELVKTKKKGEEKDKDADIAAKWQYCALTCSKLRRPIVACELGRLYNKDSVIEFLLNKDSFQGDIASHIRNLKDITELNLTEKTGFAENTGNGGEYVDSQNSPYICPVVGLDMGGKYRFVYNRKCGCVVSERALKEVKSEACHKCGADLDKDDLIPLNGSDEEVVQLRLAMEERRARAKSEKRGKKRKNEAAAVSSAAEVGIEKTSESLEAPSSSKAVKETKTSGKHHSTQGPSTKSTKNTKTSTDALLTEKAKGDYSVANDPNASETYKSIFTTHKSAQNRPTAHWVTYNPLYF